MHLETTAVALLYAASSVSAAALGTKMSWGAEKTVKESADFGLCIPTMKFEGGLGERAAPDFTFLPMDPLCARGQQEAQNPNIITNRICDQLSTACGANEAAKELCRDAQTKIRSLGTRNKSTADTWNTLLGFGGALTNPDGGAPSPKDLKKKRDVEITKREPEPLIPCSASVWIDNCTGWPRSKRDVEAAPVVKREVEIIPNPVYKRSPAADFDPEAMKSEWQKRADIPMIPCSTDVWIDDCTGWY
ncbi:hypothetical protein EDD36DRAFT_225232 [Exophiala viscosa]|uniref:Uncharacterized protein n=1 Tax=Exophiala viscosa TaxID=2486360 RepID=A0AAN6IEB8_9EURO|nr:hypothetical protein EDD36DRAFT_225232 [Exophiala viscosa]